VVNELAALVGFAFVGTVSPGPNNAVLWGSGLAFGFRRTIPHVLGTALGMAALVVGIAAGIGVLFDAVPAAEVALNVIGSAYLLYVAYLVLGTGMVSRGCRGRSPFAGHYLPVRELRPGVRPPLGTFLPTAVPRVVAVAHVDADAPHSSSAVWAAGGAALAAG
jgi:hypothetical protein